LDLVELLTSKVKTKTKLTLILSKPVFIFRQQNRNYRKLEKTFYKIKLDEIKKFSNLEKNHYIKISNQEPNII